MKSVDGRSIVSGRGFPPTHDRELQETTRMKSRILLLTALLTLGPSLIVSAQVHQLGRIQPQGGVQRASCSSCGTAPSGFYDGLVWGSNCGIGCGGGPCSMHTPLFSPCPNPCQTTLLGELVYDVKTAVDSGLSSLFGCLLGNNCFPCGCHDVCTCSEPACGVGGDCGCDAGITSTMSEPMMMMEPTPARPSPAVSNPFGDDPHPPTAAPSVIPKASASRVISPTRSPSTPPQYRPAARRPGGVRPVAYEQPVLERQEPGRLPAQATSADALTPTAGSIDSSAEHYQPRRNASLRTVTGVKLQRAPVRANGSTPALRFRETP
jgi:hypothetical protein